MSTAWAGFLHESNAEMRRTRCHGGMTWTPSVSASTLESVSDYCQGFAWSGVSVREVIRATGSSPTQVRQALARLVEDGSLRVEEQMTRGRRASKRKVYFNFETCPFVPVVEGSMGQRNMQLTPLHPLGWDDPEGC